MQRTMPPVAAMIAWTDLVHGMAGMLIGKRYLRALEAEVKAYFGVKHVFLFSSGKAALTILLKALKALAPERDEVIIPAYTCYSVPAAVMKAGLKVALCDIDPRSFDFDYRLLPGVMNEKTLCVLPTHLFGIPADVERAAAISKERSIYVVEDAAQAMGAELQGKKLGTNGDAGLFSLGRGKNITAGSGGIIVTDHERIAEAMRKEYAQLLFPGIGRNVLSIIEQLIMKIFIQPSLYWIPAGMPSLHLGQTLFPREYAITRLSGVKAGFLRGWPKRLIDANETREKAGSFYSRELSGKTVHQAGPAYLRFPLMLSDRSERDQAYAQLRRYGASLMYPFSINEVPEIRDQFSDCACPAAKRTAERLIALPTHHLLAGGDRLTLCSMLRNDRVKASGSGGVPEGLNA